ncbi:LptA/OstA family protein [Ahrensia sp. 13_GOM-1096m]|uniref:LptA/OstA family protein n=1 Tax=Ahrensia sp. 13_GOM-1096m TaxID=1380380 RepID=UPI00047A227F|nr:LptA/OstA family protein [Ahrensia sp. 13_GOM-1096m]
MTKILKAVFIASLLSLPITAAAQDNSSLALSSDKPVQIDGDKLEIFENDGKAIFSGSVSVVQDDTILRTSILTIYYAKGGEGSIATGAADIDRLLATGGVNIQSGKQVATGETGTYDMKTETFVLSGKRVTLSEDGNVATGCKLTITQSTGRAKLEGCGGTSRPTVLIQPKNKN